MTTEVTLLDFWASPFGMRVRIALAEKGVDHERREEDLSNKSELLLKMNPINKTIPVLVHNNNPVCESLNIVEYIDEVWNNNKPFLPSDPYQRAQARFWADFVENKVYKAGRKVIVATKKDDKNAAKEEIIEHLKVLEQELGDKSYFGGETFGLVDVTFIPIYSWFYAYEMARNLKIGESCPKIIEWAKRCMQRESVAKSFADEKKIYEYVLELQKRLNIE